MAKKSSKRGNGEGSIRQRTDGKWEARYSITDDFGKIKQKSVYGKTRREVSEKLSDVFNQINKGTFVEPKKVTLIDWIDEWIIVYKKPSIKPKTLECYDNVINKYIRKSKIAKMELKNIKPDDVKKFYNTIPFRRSLDFTHIVLNSALKQAVKNEMIGRNIIELLDKPNSKSEKEVKALDVDEQNEFMELYKNDRFAAAFDLLLFTGIRIGELAALKWESVDFSKNTIQIKKTLNRVKNFDAQENSPKTVLIEGPVKSTKGKRTIPLFEDLKQSLLIHKSFQDSEKATGLYDDQGYVFTNELGERREPRYYSKRLESILKDSEIKCTLHELRHTFATRCIENEIDLKTLQEIMGHADYDLTANTYAHVLMNRKIEAMEKMQKVFSNKKSG